MVYILNEETQRPIRILFAAEHEVDVMNVWLEFQKLRLGNSVYPVKSGYEVLDFLFLMGQYSYLRYETPDLIVFGTQIQDIERIKVLQYLRQAKRFSKIPILLMGYPSAEQPSRWIDAGNKVAYLPMPFEGNQFIARLACLGVPWVLKGELPAGFYGPDTNEIHERTSRRI